MPHYVVKASLRYAYGVAANRVIGLAKDILMAAFLGNNVLVATFWMAYRFIDTPTLVISEGGLRSVVVPEYEHYKHTDSQSGYRLLRDLALFVFMVAVTLAVVICLVLWMLANNGTVSLKESDVLILGAILCSALIVVFTVGIVNAGLNAEHFYFLPPFSWAVMNIVWMVGIVLFRNSAMWMAVQGIAWALVVGSVCQLAVSSIALGRLLHAQLIGGLWSAVHPFGKRVRALVPFVLFSLLSYSVPHLNVLANTFIARAADAQAPTYLFYGWRTQLIVLGLIGYAFVGGVKPALSSAIKRKDHSRYDLLMNFAFRRLVELLVPATIGLVVVASPLTRALYGWGAFTSNNVIQTTQCLVPYAVMLLPRALVFIQLIVLHAHSEYRRAAVVVVPLVLLDVVLGLIAVTWLKLPFYTVAWINCLVVWCHFGALATLVRGTDARVDFKGAVWAFVKTGVIGIIVGAITAGVYRLVFGRNIFDTDHLESAVQQLSCGIVPVAVFIGLCALGSRLYRKRAI